MKLIDSSVTIDCVTSNGKDASFFSQRSFMLSGDESRRLTERINAENFRMRTSGIRYSSEWHVAGDPTLLIILGGSMRIFLRNEEYKDFTVGTMFIAEDYLDYDIEFDNLIHGHRAQVIGDEELFAIHLKLNKRV